MKCFFLYESWFFCVDDSKCRNYFTVWTSVLMQVNCFTLKVKSFTSFALLLLCIPYLKVDFPRANHLENTAPSVPIFEFCANYTARRSRLQVVKISYKKQFCVSYLIRFGVSIDLADGRVEAKRRLLKILELQRLMSPPKPIRPNHFQADLILWSFKGAVSPQMSHLGPQTHRLCQN
jgi:hypothetical protein